MAKRNAEENEMVEENGGETLEEENNSEASNSEASKRGVKVRVDYPDDFTVAITCLGGTGTKLFDYRELPESIQEKLKPFGVMKKLGTQGACAGKEGTEAEAAMDKVWNAMKAGDWSVRVPAAPKITVKISDLAARLASLSPEEKAEKLAALAALGIELPV